MTDLYLIDLDSSADDSAFDNWPLVDAADLVQHYVDLLPTNDDLWGAL